VRGAAIPLVLAAALAAPASAQDDPAERMVREQEELRKKAVDQVMAAPSRAWSHSEADPYRPINAFPEREAAPETPPPPEPKRPSRPIPWLMLAILIPIVPLALWAFASLRRWARS
jgi:hypothetical protein